MGGDVSVYEAAVAELDSAAPPPIQLFELDLVERGRAWALAADGERSRAPAALFGRSARRRRRLFVVEAMLRHDLARLGEAQSQQVRLGVLAERIDGELAAALADHAAHWCPAPARRSSRRARFVELGVDLLAAEAALAAAAPINAEGCGGERPTARLARRLIVACGGGSPAMQVELGLVVLTAASGRWPPSRLGG